MTSKPKTKLSDILKKVTEKNETEVKKSTSPVTSTKTPAKGVSSSAKASLEAFKKSQLGKDTRAKQEEILKTKTHQDLVNAVYKVADELKVEGGPWPMLRAAEWGNFTDDRGKLYKGPIIDDIKGFTDEQKAALKKQLGI
jgi:hypothetical protein